MNIKIIQSSIFVILVMIAVININIIICTDTCIAFLCGRQEMKELPYGQ